MTLIYDPKTLAIVDAETGTAVAHLTVGDGGPRHELGRLFAAAQEMKRVLKTEALGECGCSRRAIEEDAPECPRCHAKAVLALLDD